MRRLVIALLGPLWLGGPAPVDANPACRWLGLCLYLSPGFELTVVDAETGKPLADVYGWAEWVQNGYHGTDGPLMIQEATSGADGRLSFPRWGPRWGSRAGLEPGSDPAVILFKPGYATLLAQNAGDIGTNPLGPIRGFYLDGTRVRLQPFTGSVPQWIGELRKLVFPAYPSRVSIAQRETFRGLYLRRADVVAAEIAHLPPQEPGVVEFRSLLELDVEFFRGAR